MTTSKFDDAARKIDRVLCAVGMDNLREMLETPDPNDHAYSAFVDQADAAQRELHACFTSDMAVAEGGTIGETVWKQHPEWVRIGMLSAYLRWVRGESRLCSHKPRIQQPQPTLTAAWKSNFVACVRCTNRTSPPTGGIEHYTCDGCGKVGTEMVTEKAIAFGPFVYTFGCCNSCVYT